MSIAQLLQLRYEDVLQPKAK